MSVVAPWGRPNFADPPFFGSAPMPAWLSIVVANAVVTPRAATRPMNSRREIRLFLIWSVQYSNSVICVSLTLSWFPSCGISAGSHDLTPQVFDRRHRQ